MTNNKFCPYHLLFRCVRYLLLEGTNFPFSTSIFVLCGDNFIILLYDLCERLIYISISFTVGVMQNRERRRERGGRFGSVGDVKRGNIVIFRETGERGEERGRVACDGFGSARFARASHPRYPFFLATAQRMLSPVASVVEIWRFDLANCFRRRSPGEQFTKFSILRVSYIFVVVPCE